MALAEDIASVLITAGVAAALGTDLFIGDSPASPDSVVTIYEYAGLEAMSVQNGRHKYRRPYAQIACRDSDYSAARATANAAYDALVAVVNTTINSVFYLMLTPQQEPFSIARDTQERPLFVFNVAALKGH